MCDAPLHFLSSADFSLLISNLEEIWSVGQAPSGKQRLVVGEEGKRLYDGSRGWGVWMRWKESLRRTRCTDEPFQKRVEEAVHGTLSLFRQSLRELEQQCEWIGKEIEGELPSSSHEVRVAKARLCRWRTRILPLVDSPASLGAIHSVARLYLPSCERLPSLSCAEEALLHRVQALIHLESEVASPWPYAALRELARGKRGKREEEEVKKWVEKLNGLGTKICPDQFHGCLVGACNLWGLSPSRGVGKLEQLLVELGLRLLERPSLFFYGEVERIASSGSFGGWSVLSPRISRSSGAPPLRLYPLEGAAFSLALPVNQGQGEMEKERRLERREEPGLVPCQPLPLSSPHPGSFYMEKIVCSLVEENGGGERETAASYFQSLVAAFEPLVREGKWLEGLSLEGVGWTDSGALRSWECLEKKPFRYGEVSQFLWELSRREPSLFSTFHTALGLDQNEEARYLRTLFSRGEVKRKEECANDAAIHGVGDGWVVKKAEELFVQREHYEGRLQAFLQERYPNSQLDRDPKIQLRLRALIHELYARHSPPGRMGEEVLERAYALLEHPLQEERSPSRSFWSWLKVWGAIRGLKQ